MEQALPQEQQPVRIAHRGAPLVSGTPENSRNAFEGALTAGFTRVETDLRLTDDGRMVLAHNAEQVPDAEALEPNWPVLRQFEWINLELKERAVVPLLAAWLEAHVRDEGLRKRLILSSFDPAALMLAQQKLPWMRLAALFLPTVQDFNLEESLAPASIHITKEFAAAHPERPKAFGMLPVNAFTVNDKTWLNRMPGWVHGVFTDALSP